MYNYYLNELLKDLERGGKESIIIVDPKRQFNSKVL